MLDKALAAISIACLVAFVSVLIVYIGEVDLVVVSVVVLLMAAYDFFLLNRSQPQSDERAAEHEPPR
jgi:hypothetical protein